MGHNNGIDDLLDETKEIKVNEKEDVVNSITARLDLFKRNTEKFANGDDLEALHKINNFLHDHKTKKSSSKLDDKVKYVIWGFGIVIGIVIGWMLSSVMSYLTRNVDAFNSVGGPITLLIFLICAGLGWFAAHWYTDKR